jgi:hypothetical protein
LLRAKEGAPSIPSKRRQKQYPQKIIIQLHQIFSLGR